MGRHTSNAYVTNRTYAHQHDDRYSDGRGRGRGRWTRSRGSKHVSFQDRSHSGVHKRLGVKIAQSKLGDTLRQVGYIDQDDQSMGSFASSSSHQAGRARPLQRGRGRMRGRGSMSYRSTTDLKPSTWHKIIVQQGSRFEKRDVLQAINQAVIGTVPNDKPFVPISYNKAGANTFFFIECAVVADGLKKLSAGGVPMPDGSVMLSIRVQQSSPPPTPPVSLEVSELIKKAMSNRYNSSTKALNLQCFHRDAVFLEASFYVPLYRAQVAREVVQLIQDNIADVENIDLSDNRLSNLSAFETLTKAAPNVKLVLLANNRIFNEGELDMLSGWKLLTSLTLEENPLKMSAKDNDAFQRIVRRHLPNLEILDGQPMPKRITFAGEDDASTTLSSTLPKAQMKMSSHPEAESVALQFLKAYFEKYDQKEQRQTLLEAYHDEAVFSLSCAYPLNTSAHGSAKLGEYIMESRNVKRVTDSTRRSKLLRKTKLSIVSLLTELPATQHDLNSFTLDMPLVESNFMTLTLTGVFKEITNTQQQPIRHFSRSFVLLLNPNGTVAILNDMLFVTLANPLQNETAFTPNIVRAVGIEPASTPAPQQPQSSENEAKMGQLAAATGMNLEYSKRVLESSGWNLDQALTAFNQAKAKNEVPPEAMAK